MNNYFLLLTALFYTVSVNAEPYSVGVSAPLTGDLAEFGAAVRNGFVMASEEISTVKSAVPLTFVYEDNRYEAGTSITAYRKLVDERQVDMIFSWGEVPLHATAAMAERNGMPLLAMSVDAEPARNKQHVMLAVNHPREFITPTLNQLRSRALKRFGFVVTDDPYFTALLSEFRAALRSDESIEIIGTSLPGDTDFRALVTRIRGRELDALGVYLLPGQVQSFYRQLAEVKISIPSFGTDTLESRSEIVASGPAITGAVYTNLAVPEEFLTRYRARYSTDAHISYAFNAYVVARRIGRMVQAGKRPDRRAAIAAFTSAKNDGDGIPALRDAEFRFLRFPVVIRRIEDGKFVDLGS